MYNFTNVVAVDWRIFGQPGLDDLRAVRDLRSIEDVLVPDPLDFGQPIDPWMADDLIQF